MIRWTNCALLGCALAMSSTLTARADWPFFAPEGQPLRGTPEYNQLHAGDPPGARQVYKHGKFWPPQPRPIGPAATFAHRYHHTHYWPYPYTCQDRAAVHSFVNVQVANGWQQHTTLFDYHFDPVSNELNSSGKAHLNWILFNVPPEHQQVTVATANEPARTSARMANVQREVAQLAGANPGFPILARRVEAVGRPAGEVQAIFTSALENMPPPILSQTAGDAGGGNAQ
jgi:hypothetical protein